ncbi:hypothetical protein SO802_021438 [Lithocarpus litseifolius]|uniref:Uncharacterized protein n=1 Tax=Lithocarpus litseifolius TaxID=425828 RepID=A0AAW2CHA7_9ROSI
MTVTPYDFYRVTDLSFEGAIINLDGVSSIQLGLNMLGRKYSTKTIRYFDLASDYVLLPQKTTEECVHMARAFLLHLWELTSSPTPNPKIERGRGTERELSRLLQKKKKFHNWRLQGGISGGSGHYSAASSNFRLGLLFSFHAAPRLFLLGLNVEHLGQTLHLFSQSCSLCSYLCWLKSWLLKLATTNHPLRPITTVQ